MQLEVMEFIVFVVEKTARAFFAGDKRTAYNKLKSCGILYFYINNYETSHSLGIQNLLEEIREMLNKKRVNIC